MRQGAKINAEGHKNPLRKGTKKEEDVWLVGIHVLLKT